jgi:hypothetical protein
MQLNGFRVTIPEAKEENSEGHVVLSHGQNFRISLHNAHKYNGRGTPSDCEVYVQGEYVGTYHVPAGQTVILEHPIHDSGKFTAYRNGSSEAQQIGLDPNSDDNGLIKVVWKPGNHKVRSIQVSDVSWTWPYHPNIVYPENDNYYDDGHNYTITYDDHTFNNSATGGYVSRKGLFSSNVSCCANAGNLVGGGIGLSGSSNQTFTETDALDYVEPETAIYLRIAFREESNTPRPIKPVYKVHSTSVPRRLQ